MLGGAGRQLALLVLGRIGLGARIDKAPAEQAIVVLAQIKLFKGCKISRFYANLFGFKRLGRTMGRSDI